MKRPLKLFLATLALAAPIEAQLLKAQLEVNLGPILIDSYDGISQNSYSGVTSGPNIPACSYGAGSNYRTCMQSVLASYSQQGVTGVRIYFSMNGEAGSTPFLDTAGDLSAVWKANFSLFLQDLRAANLRYVSFTPVWGTFGTGNMSIYACLSSSGPPYIYNFNCNSTNANAVFYPWLPWGLTYAPATPPSNPFASQGGPFDEFTSFAFDNAPRLGDPRAPQGSPLPWVWSSDPKSGSPLFNFFDFIFGAVASAQLSVREVDIFPEVPMRASSLYGRLTYDPVQLVAPMSIINQIMQLHGLTPAAALSTAAFEPQNDQYCNSPYNNFVNSGLVLDEFLLLSASASGSFGSVFPDSQNHYCGTINPTDMITALPSAGLTLVDVHTYPADYITDNGWGWISVPNATGPQHYPDGAPITNSPIGCAASGCTQDISYDFDTGNSSGTSQTAANMTYNAIAGFVAFWQISNLPVIIGETDEYNPGGLGRDGILFPSMTEGSDCTTYGPYGSILNDTYTDPGTGVVHNVNFWCTPDWKWHRPWSSTAAFENAGGFAQSGLNQANTVVRPWAPVSWGTVLSPAPLSGSASLPYNVGACAYPASIAPVVVPAEATNTSVGIGPVTSSCWWSTGPTPVPGSNAVYPVWFTLASPAWQQGTGQITANLAINSTGSPRSLQLTIAGITVTFTQNSVLAPTPLTPANGAAGVAASPSLTWTSSAGATGYVLSFGTSPNSLSVLTTLSGANSTSYSLSSLQPGTTYYWQVQAVNSLGGSAFTVASFTTAQAVPAPPALTTPANGATQVSLTPALSWSASAGVSAYNLYLGTQNPPPVYMSGLSGSATNFTPPQALAASTTYYWQVAATNALGSAASAIFSFTTQAVPVRAVFRNAAGGIDLITYPSATLSAAGGVFGGDPTAAEDASGNVFVAAKDTFGTIWLNLYNAGSSAWAGWTVAAGNLQGTPSLAVDPSGKAWLAVRDNWTSYWLVSYTRGTGFGTWMPLEGLFSTDPVVTACADGSVYMIGKDTFNALWSAHYVPGSGFQGWQFGGGVIQGKPSATCGGDNAVYIAAEDFFNSNWAARVAGNTWTGWFYGGAITSVAPRIAALGNGSEAIVILDSTNVVWRTTFTEGTGNGWQPWTQVGGILQDIAPVGAGGQLYFAGKGLTGDLWWWQQSGSQWTWANDNGAAAGALAGTPR